MRYFWINILFVCVYSLTAQESINLSFDNCDGMDTAGGFDATIVGGPECRCGVADNSLYLDGDVSHISFDPETTNLFNGDFTLSFYFWPEAAPGTAVDIFSIRSSCDRDSSLSIRYFEDLNRLIVEFASDVANIKEVSGPLDLSKCWQHLAIGKNGDQIYLYLNGDIVDTDRLVTDFVFDEISVPSFANSPCLDFNEVRFQGRIDEIRFFQDALSESELNALDLFPDQIVVSDTTIFSGATIDLITGGTCSTAFFWQPEDSLDDPLITSPTAQPDLTTSYIWTINHGNCVTRDTIVVRVLQEQDFDCAKLLLPSAFTPNNDQINDTYGISNSFIIDELQSFEIFDKWGTKLFETTDKDASWDGFLKSQDINSTTLFHRVEYTCGGEGFIKYDSFVLLR